MNQELERAIKIAQGISFTTFLILCVGVLTYAMVHLYTDSRTDWSQVQVNSQNIDRMSGKVDALVDKIDGLLTELNFCVRPPVAITSYPTLSPVPTAFGPFLTPPRWVVKTHPENGPRGFKSF